MRGFGLLIVFLFMFAVADVSSAAEFVRGRPLRNVGTAIGKVVTAPGRAIRANRARRGKAVRQRVVVRRGGYGC